MSIGNSDGRANQGIRAGSTEGGLRAYALPLDTAAVADKKIPEYLKLHVEALPEPPPPALAESGPLGDFCRAFERATGWSLECVAAASGPGRASACNSGDEALTSAAKWSAALTDAENRPIARFALRRGGGDSDAVTSRDSRATSRTAPLEDVKPLASAAAGLWSKVERLRYALWQREAELAVGVPVVSRRDEEPHLALRLEAALKAAATSIGCHAAALYLLDDATSQLKLRAAWGIARDRFLVPARPLRGAVADLEALVGHAVALEDAHLLPAWKPPEDFADCASAVCVPVSSPTCPLGTLWVYSREPRSFTDEHTNLVEIVAGRIAADLEREVLLSQGMKSSYVATQLDRAARWQQDRLPRIAPILEGWQVGGAASDTNLPRASFYDWNVLPDGNLSVAVGRAHGGPLEAALSVAAVQAAVRAHSCHVREPKRLLAEVNETLWSGSPGDCFASLFYGVLEPETGRLMYASAGSVGAIVLGAAGSTDSPRRLVASHTPPLGVEPEITIAGNQCALRSGESLVVASQEFFDSAASPSDPTPATPVPSHRQSAAQLANWALEHFRNGDGGKVETAKHADDERSALVVLRESFTR